MSRAQDIYKKIKKEGKKAIDEFILTRKSEELFLDFKRSADNGEGRTLHQNDRKTLGKAISGFGNSEGGVVVWGVECSQQSDKGDVASAKVPIKDVKKFVSLLESSISGLTLPPHTLVENHPVQINKKGEGFAASYIPQGANIPLQAVYNKQFYIRAGSSFEPTPYQVLAGMFGRRPQPFVFVNYLFAPAKIDQKIATQIGFLVHNRGPGIAKNLFINATVKSSPGPNCEIALETRDKNWAGAFSLGRFMSLISKPSFRLPPEAHVQPLILNTTFLPPFTDKLEISIMVGAEDTAPMKSSLTNSKSKIESAYKKYAENIRGKSWTKELKLKATQEIMGRAGPPNS